MTISRQYFHVTRPRKLRKSINQSGRKSLPLARHLEERMKCDVCREEREIARKLSLTDGDGVLIDSVMYCGRCWNEIRLAVGRESGVIDLPAKLR